MVLCVCIVVGALAAQPAGRPGTSTVFGVVFGALSFEKAKPEFGTVPRVLVVTLA